VVTWATDHWVLTFILAWGALGVLRVWGEAVRKRVRIVRVEPPPPLQSNVTIEQVCPRCGDRLGPRRPLRIPFREEN